jgi:hypothetical protein
MLQTPVSFRLKMLTVHYHIRPYILLIVKMLVNISNHIKGTAHLTSSSTLVTSAWDPKSTFNIEGGFARE